MRFILRVMALFYVVLVLMLSAGFLLTLYGQYSMLDVQHFFQFLKRDPQAMLVSQILIAIILLETIIFYWTFLYLIRSRRRIHFDNPTGRVTVSLDAIENLVRGEISQMPQVKDLKTKIQKRKRKLIISIRLILGTDMNIPEETARFQNIIKKQIQNTIGLEQDIEIYIDIDKIHFSKSHRSHSDDHDKKKEPAPTNVPFPGYRV